MSYAAYKMMHWATGIENCASGFIIHSPAELTAQIPPIQVVDLESEWPAKRRIGPIPNVVVTAANVLELYTVRVQEDDDTSSQLSSEPRNGGIMDGLSGARLELVCHYRCLTSSYFCFSFLWSRFILFERLPRNSCTRSSV